MGGFDVHLRRSETPLSRALTVKFNVGILLLWQTNTLDFEAPEVLADDFVNMLLVLHQRRGALIQPRLGLSRGLRCRFRRSRKLGHDQRGRLVPKLTGCDGTLVEGLFV